MDNINSLVVPILIAVVPVIVGWFLKDVLKVFSNYLKEINDDEYIDKYIDKAEKIVIDSVLEVSQTFVDVLKENGKFDVIAQRQAFEKARKNILLLLTEEGQAIIDFVYGDLDLWIQTQIEATVKSLKVD